MKQVEIIVKASLHGDHCNLGIIVIQKHEFQFLKRKLSLDSIVK